MSMLAKPQSRAEIDATLVEQMANTLRSCDAWRSEGDAIRALVGRYRTDDILQLVDKARTAVLTSRRSR